MNIEPITLSGRFIRMEPLSADHRAGLQAAAAHPEIWAWTWPGADPEAVSTWVDGSRAAAEARRELPFTVFDAGTGAIAGSTRFMGIDPANRVVEIGNTWYAPAYQRTPVNTESKYLLLRHAFEVWDCIRVEFKTDANNAQSRAAIANVGAVEEGIRRHHLIVPGGRIRDSAMFSIIPSEWPGVKRRLEAKLARDWVRA